MSNYRLGTTTIIDSPTITGTSSFTSINVSSSATFTSHIIVDGYTIDLGAGATSSQVLAYNGTKFVATNASGGAGAVASSSDQHLTTTSPTTVVTFTPSSQGNYVVHIYYRVVTATTNITVTLTWTDGSGAQSDAIVPLSSQAVGSYVVSPTYLNSTNAAITVSATAGTANNIFISASIMGA